MNGERLNSKFKIQNSKLRIWFTAYCLLLLLLPALAEAGHFPAPAYTTNSAAYFLGSFKINSLPAQPGDEVAFFDPQGVLCGLYVVDVSGQYGRVTVYGDDTLTSSIDEGALPGDILTIKIWDSRSGVELEGSALALTQGFFGGNSTPSLIPPQWQDNIDYALNIDTATHFPKPNTSLYSGSSVFWGNLTIKGQLPEIGDEIGVFDASGTAVGHFLVITPDNKYGFMSVYGNSSTHSGTPLTFKIWDKSAGIEYAKSNLILKQGTPPPNSSFIVSPLPPVWNDNASYALDIEITQTNNYSLTITKSGTGLGAVISSPSGIDCGTACFASFASATVITLTAEASENSTFAGWSGDCSGNAATTTVTMDDDKTCNAEFTIVSEYLSISLTAGWNFISLPEQPTDPAIEHVLADISTNVRIIWSYDNLTKQWLKYSPNSQLPTPNSLDVVESGKGYWIYMDAPVTLTFVSQVSSPQPVTLYEGWNLVGYSGQNNAGTQSHLSSLSDKWTIAWNWDKQAWRFIRNVTPILLPSIFTDAPLKTFKRGKAYWIKMNAATSWQQ